MNRAESNRRKHLRAGAFALVTMLWAVLGVDAVAAPCRVARLKYGGGGDWYANPTGLPNLIEAVNNRTVVRLSDTAPTVEPGSSAIFDYAALFVTGHGNIAFTQSERANLRTYLLNGGFMHVDDNYGLDEHLRGELRDLFPTKKLVELPFSHPIYHCLYDFPKGLPKIHEHHGGPPHGYAIIHEGRVVLFYSYNTDLNDGWEDEDVHNDPPQKREQALRMGVNILVHALTH